MNGLQGPATVVRHGLAQVTPTREPNPASTCSTHGRARSRVCGYAETLRSLNWTLRERLSPRAVSDTAHLEAQVSRVVTWHHTRLLCNEGLKARPIPEFPLPVVGDHFLLQSGFMLGSYFLGQSPFASYRGSI